MILRSILVLQAGVVLAAGGFIVGKERVSTCAGSITIIQGGSETGTILGSTPSLKLKKVKEVVMRVEGNCCWTVHARKKFKGFKTFVRSQGELKVSRKRLRSVSRTDCSKMPRIYVAGGGYLAFVMAGLLGIIISLYAVMKKVLHKRKYKKTFSVEMSEFEVHDDDDKEDNSNGETITVKSENKPIMPKN